jgi:hypothetical protein
MPAYGKALERMIEKDIAAGGEAPKTDDEPSVNWPDKKVANPFESSDDGEYPKLCV